MAKDELNWRKNTLAGLQQRRKDLIDKGVGPSGRHQLDKQISFQKTEIRKIENRKLVPKGGGGGISPHIVGTKGGEKVHASTFYDKSGGLNRAQYSKLTPNQKAAVLSHGVSKYKEQYVPKAGQGKMNDAQKAQNRKVGEFEGIRRATLQRASKTSKGSGEWRALMHIAIQMQQKIGQQKGNVQTAGSKVASAVIGAVRSSAQQPGRGGR